MIKTATRIKRRRILIHSLGTGFFAGCITVVVLALIKVDVMRFGDNLARLVYVAAFIVIASSVILGFRSLFLLINEISIGVEIVMITIGALSALTGILTTLPFLSGEWSGVASIRGVPVPLVLIPLTFLGIGCVIVFKGFREILRKKFGR